MIDAFHNLELCHADQCHYFIVVKSETYFPPNLEIIRPNRFLTSMFVVSYLTISTLYSAPLVSLAPHAA